MGYEYILIIGIIALPLLSQGIISLTYNKYSKVNNSIKMSGKDAARLILDKNGLERVQINCIEGNLTDHYNPQNNTVNLSQNIYSGTSIASVAVAAHEVGHAIQAKENYSFLVFRSKLVPIVNFTSRFATIFIFLGFFLQIIGLIEVGIILLLAGLLFQFITLPVEFNASNRARKQLTSCGLITKKDTTGTKKVLRAAAFTYVANFIATALQILRLVLISRRR